MPRAGHLPVGRVAVHAVHSNRNDLAPCAAHRCPSRTSASRRRMSVGAVGNRRSASLNAAARYAKGPPEQCTSRRLHASQSQIRDLMNDIP